MIIVAITTVIGGAAGYAGALLKGKEYSSTAQMVWDPSSLRYTNANAYVPDSTSLGVQISTQALKVLSDDVVDPASTTLGISAKELRKEVAVSASSSTNQLSVTATAASPDRARAVTAAVVQAYRTQVRADFSAQYTQQADALQDSIDALQLQVDATPRSSSSLSDNLSAQLATLTSQQIVLRAQATDTQIPVTTFRAPLADSSPSGASPSTLAVVGAGLGLLIGLGLFALVRVVQLNRRAGVSRADTQPVRTVTAA